MTIRGAASRSNASIFSREPRVDGDVCRSRPPNGKQRRRQHDSTVEADGDAIAGVHPSQPPRFLSDALRQRGVLRISQTALGVSTAIRSGAVSARGKDPSTTVE